MGEIVLLLEGMPELLPMRGRSKGLHVSHVIHDMCIRMGHYQERDDSDRNQAQLELGNAVEHALIERYMLHSQDDEPDRYVRPGELEKDGMFGTPDLVDFYDSAINEFKLTWMSAKQQPDGMKFWKYWTQVKAYCYMMDWLIGRLHVMFVNGYYPGKDTVGFGYSPIYRLYEHRFTRPELERNWLNLQQHAESMARRAT